MMIFPLQELMDEQKCYDYLLHVLHPNGLRCPAGHPLAQGQQPHDRHRAAHFALAARLEDLDLSPKRGLDRRQVLELAQGEWVQHHLNLLVLGPTGAGKTYLACTLGVAACRSEEHTSELQSPLHL